MAREGFWGGACAALNGGNAITSSMQCRQVLCTCAYSSVRLHLLLWLCTVLYVELDA